MVESQVLTVAQMRAAEQDLIDRGSSVDRLMKLAGDGAAEWVWRVGSGRRVTVLCGPGNNGGDGYVIAENLRRCGAEVLVVAPMAPKTDAAKSARSRFGGPVVSDGGKAKGGVLVDCLFGSGLTRPLEPEHALALRDLGKRHEQLIAIDLPSGIESDGGKILNENLPAYDLTLALGAWKHAHWRLPARVRMGEVRLVPIGIGHCESAARLIGKPNIGPPASDAHKYTRGLCAVIAGKMAGAALLSSMAAMRAGAGYVKLVSDHSHPSAPAGLVLETGDLDEALADSRVRAVLIGPGLGRDNKARAKLTSVLSSKKSAVLDADALHLLDPSQLHRDCSYVATPHDGELEALGKNFAVLAADRVGKALGLAKASGMVVVAKGPDTVVAAPDGRLALARPAPTWLSTAGTGDILAGIAVSRMATGIPAFEAACDAVWLHGEAARLAGPAFIADDLAHKVADAMAAAL